MVFGAYCTGAFGQSRELYEARNAEKRQRGDPLQLGAAVRAQIRSDTDRLITLQREAGLSPISDPMLGWYYLFQAFAEGVQGVTIGPQENWFNTNVFYRRPQITHGIDPSSSGFTAPRLHPDLLPYNRLAILPSPFTLLELSDVHGYSDRRSALHDLALLLRNEAQELAKCGFTRIQYDEPALVYKQSLGSCTAEDQQLLAIALEHCGKIPGATTSLHTSFGDAGPLLPFLRELPVDCVGVDATETKLDDILSTSFEGKELAVGLLDARSAWLEDAEQVAHTARRIADATNPTALWVTPNTGTTYIGWDLGLEKLRILGTALKHLNHG